MPTNLTPPADARALLAAADNAAMRTALGANDAANLSTGNLPLARMTAALAALASTPLTNAGLITLASDINPETKIKAVAHDGIVTFNFNQGNFPSGGIEARTNQVFHIGWNISAGGGQEVVGEAGYGFGFENYWAPSGDATAVHEFYLQQIKPNGVTYRPWGWLIQRSGNYILHDTYATETRWYGWTGAGASGAQLASWAEAGSIFYTPLKLHSDLTFNAANHMISVDVEPVNAGKTLTLRAGSTNTGTGSAGGNLILQAGNSSTATDGVYAGDVELVAGKNTHVSAAYNGSVVFKTGPAQTEVARINAAGLQIGNVTSAGALGLASSANGDITLSPHGTGSVAVAGKIDIQGSIARFSTSDTFLSGNVNGLEVGYYTGGARGLVQAYNRGAATYLPLALVGSVIHLEVGAAEVARLDANATAGETRMLLYDVTAGTLQRVSIGAADSGGTGFRCLRIPN